MACTPITPAHLHQALLQYLSALGAGGVSEQNGVKDAEPLEIAVQCVTEATGVELNRHAKLVNAGLMEIFERGVKAIQDIEADPKYTQFLSVLHEKGEFFKGVEPNSLEYAQRLAQARSRFLAKFPTDASSSAAASSPSPAPAEPSSEDKAKAEAAKNAGNALLGQGKHREAVAKYSEALALNPGVAVYWANRAAANIHLKEYASAASDCRRAIALDESYAKAHYRLGQALSAQGDHKQALSSFERALQLSGKDEGMAVTIREQIKLMQQKLNPTPAASVADPFAALSGLGGPGGLDFGSLLNNPALGGLLNNPEVQGMMQSPQFADMMKNLDLGSLMKDMAGGMAQGQAQAEQQAKQAGAAEAKTVDTNYRPPDPSSLFDDEPAPAAAAPGGAPTASAASAASSASGFQANATPSPLAAFLSTPAGQAAASDPDLKPVLEDVAANGMGAAMKYMGNPRVMQKIQGIMGPMMAGMGKK